MRRASVGGVPGAPERSQSLSPHPLQPLHPLHVSADRSHHRNLIRWPRFGSHSTEKLREKREEMEMAVAQMQNELARIRVDTLNTMSHNSQLGAPRHACNVCSSPPGTLPLEAPLLRLP